MDPAAVITAIGGAAGTIGAVYVKLRSLDRKISTNHGLRPGEYLEMIGDIREDVAVIKAQGERTEAKADQALQRVAVVEHQLR